MANSASKLRQDIYEILDGVIEAGAPVEIERRGRILRIIPAEGGPSKLERLEPHPDAIRCDPEDLVHVDWSGFWRP